MLKTDTRTIDDLEVHSSQLPALRAFALFARMGKVLAPALGKMQGLSMQADVSALGPALSELFSRLDGAEAKELAKEILCATVVLVEGKRLTLSTDEAINMVFNGKLRTFIKTMAFALEVNFADFIAAVRDSVPAAALEKANGSNSTTT